MPIPFILGGIALAAAAIGVQKTVEAYDDTKKADEISKKAKSIYKSAERSLKKEKKNCTDTLEKLWERELEILSSSIYNFVRLFEKIKSIQFNSDIPLEDLKNLDFSKEKMLELKQASINAFEITGGGIAAVSSGVLAGFGATGAVGLLASASTGTAISTLSGAAATNATLAWLGGGSLATGGFGMAGGMMVLGGIVAAPVLAVGGAIWASKAKENLSKAKCNLSKAKIAAEQMKTAEAKLKAIKERAEMILQVINQLDILLTDSNKELLKIFNANRPNANKIIRNFSKNLSDRLYTLDYGELKKTEKENLFKTTQLAMTLKNILDVPLLSKKGNLTQKSEKILESSKLYLEKL